MEILINKNNEIVIRLTNGAEVRVEEYGDNNNMARVEVNDIHKIDVVCGCVGELDDEGLMRYQKDKEEKANG